LWDFSATASFQVLYALAKLLSRFEGEANEGVGVLESLIDVGPVLGMADINVGHHSFGNQVQFMSEAFDQDTAMALDLLQPFIHFSSQPLEFSSQPLEFSAQLLEFSAQTLEFPAQLLELRVNHLESAIEELNEFLIHCTSENGKSMTVYCPCQ